MSGRLLVVVAEPISEWIEKGEVVDRYYNPGDRFAEVHLLLLNDDSPDPRAVQRLVGSARPVLHNFPAGRRLMVRSAGWEPRLLRSWAEQAVTLAREVRPQIVRCYGANVNGALALEIRRALGVPVVVSLHTLPGDPANPSPTGFWSRFEDIASRRVARRVLCGADLVIAVYQSLVPYLTGLGARRIEVVYNALNGKALKAKEGYDLHEPVRVISVGRQIAGKDPAPLVRAVAARPEAELTLVGDGSLHESLRGLIRDLDANGRISLRKAIPNDELVASLSSFDIFAAHNDYLGVPKAVLEPMLAGLPLLLNRGPNGPVPELHEGVCLLVDPTAAGYASGLDRLIGDASTRVRLGSNARAWAEEACAPEKVEARIAALYEELIKSMPSAR